jgi:hypothetical protein
MLRPERWLGRTEFRPEDYTRALVMATAIVPTRAKWRSSQSARSTTLKKCLTEAGIVRDGRFWVTPEDKRSIAAGCRRAGCGGKMREAARIQVDGREISGPESRARTVCEIRGNRDLRLRS